MIQVFDLRKDGIVRWFSAPPVDIVSTTIPHTSTYLEFKSKQKMKLKKEGGLKRESDKNVNVNLNVNVMERVELEMEVDVDKERGDGSDRTSMIEKTLYGLGFF